jgi:hypothetical protein
LFLGSQKWCGVGIILGHRDNAVFGADDEDDDVSLGSV